jgi:threonine dehydrogenase-like Zn-dependent dehydrogenase
VRALTVVPGTPGSAEITDGPEPQPGPGELLVEGLALGICGTDREILAGEYGWAPPGADRLVLGHESLGRVLQAPDGSGFTPGDLVAGVVRRRRRGSRSSGSAGAPGSSRGGSSSPGPARSACSPRCWGCSAAWRSTSWTR